MVDPLYIGVGVAAARFSGEFVCVEKPSAAPRRKRFFPSIGESVPPPLFAAAMIRRLAPPLLYDPWCQSDSWISRAKMAGAKRPRAVSKLANVGRKRAASTLRQSRRSREDILNRIIEAATDEFNRFGYAATTATVARKAGVTEAQLFRYFGSKSNLFKETIFNPVNVHLQNFLTKHFPEGVDDRERTNLYTSELQQFLSEHSGAFTSLIFAETYRNGSDVGVSGIDSLQKYFELGSALVKRRTRRKTKIDPDLFVRLTFVTVLGCVMFKKWIFPPGIATNAETSRALVDFINLAIAGNTTERSG